VREEIILLIFSIKRKEEINKSHHNPNEMIAPMFVDKYDDEWKQIFD
jgi:c-di-AMP phosphodiesterase-like protein